MRQEEQLTDSKTGQIKPKELELLLWIMRLLLLISQGINLGGLAGWVRTSRGSTAVFSLAAKIVLLI